MCDINDTKSLFLSVIRLGAISLRLTLKNIQRALGRTDSLNALLGA